MDALMILVIAAILVEAIVERLGEIFTFITGMWKMILSLIVSIAICILAGVDLFPIIGFDLIVPYAGMVITGIIVSRGSNYLADLMKNIQLGSG